MSNLFHNFKNNIITNITPFQTALRTHANLFIETFINDDYGEDEELYSDDFETDSNHDSDADDERESNKNQRSDQKLYAPTQQVFYDTLSNSELSMYSPIDCPNSNNKSITDIKECNAIEKINPDDNATNTNGENILCDELLISNLSVLAKIDKYQKLSIYCDQSINNKLNFQVQIDNSYLPQFSRWYYNQGRANTISTIGNLIDYAIQQTSHYKKVKNEEYTKKYNELLNSAKNGLSNLKITYESDIESALKINAIIEKINNFS
jgi:hypothetical protein